MKNVLVSVIVPVYKVELYLERCLKSIISQTYKNLEIILVDDGSPDKCPEICDQYAEYDKRIKVIHKPNGGLSSARNAGIDVMNGEYVTFIDSDDFIPEDAIEKWVHYIKEYHADIVAGKYQMYYKGDILERNSTGKAEKWSACDALRYMFIIDGKLCSAWGKLYDARLFERLRYPEDIQYAEDMYVIHLLFHEAENIVFTNDVQYYYSQEGESLVRSAFSEKKLQRAEAVEKWIKFIEEFYPELKEEILSFYGGILIDLCMEIEDNSADYAQAAYKKYRSILVQEYMSFIRNRYMRRNNRIKLFMIKNKCTLPYQLYRKRKLSKRIER